MNKFKLHSEYKKIIKERGTPIIEVDFFNGEDAIIYNISPLAIRDLRFKEHNISFYASYESGIEFLFINYSNIIDIYDDKGGSCE